MDSYHHKSGSKKRKEKISREESAKRGQKSLSKFLVPGRDNPTNTDDAVMVSLESDTTDADVDNKYISRYDSELTWSNLVLTVVDVVVQYWRFCRPDLYRLDPLALWLPLLQLRVQL